MSEIEAPKAYLTEAQWQHLKANEDMRTREMMRHNAIIQQGLADAIAIMSGANAVGSLRDTFAGQALANAYTHSDNSPDKAGEWAYHIADAMIAAREGSAGGSLIAVAPDLLEAGRKLAAEVRAQRAFEHEIRAAIGNTNWSVLIDRLAGMDAAIAKAEGRS